MKQLYRISIFLVALFSITVISYAQNFDAAIKAMKNASAAELAKLFDRYVEITLPEKSNTYSKSQAEVVMKDFFNTHPVTGFDIKHKGENGGNQFCIGELNTKKGKFRTTLFLKQKGSVLFLQEIRMEKPEQDSIVSGRLRYML